MSFASVAFALASIAGESGDGACAGAEPKKQSVLAKKKPCACHAYGTNDSVEEILSIFMSEEATV